MSRSRTLDLDSGDLWARARRAAASRPIPLPAVGDPAKRPDPDSDDAAGARPSSGERRITFDAGDLREALRRARRELGSEALIVSTRTIPRTH